MTDVTTPSKENKMQLIEDMGIDWRSFCPFLLKLKCRCISNKQFKKKECGDCWIKSLED